MDVELDNTFANSKNRVLARKYRPLNFKRLIGQQTLIRTLSGSIERNRLAHAYMLTGVRGVGKTTTARIIAKVFNCLNPEKIPEISINPCGKCECCLGIASGDHIDVLEMDAASHTGVDNIRDLIDGVGYKPVTSKYRIYIIDEVHMLSKGAFNALLKTLEEPPDHVKFIFATTEIRKVPITVLSRCQRFDLQRVLSEQLIEYLNWICDQEGIKFSNEALQIIVRVSGGSVRDALSLLDQSASISGDNIKSENISYMLGLPNRLSSIDILNNVLSGEIAEALGMYDNIINHGSNSETMVCDMLDILHLSTRLLVGGEKNENVLLFAVPESEKNGIKKISKFSLPDLTRAWQILLKGLEEIRSAPNSDEAGSMILIRLSYASSLPDPASLVKKINSSFQSHENKVEPNIGNQVSEKDQQSDFMNQNDIEKQEKEPEDFEEMVKLFKVKGELLIHAKLNSCVHLVSFEKGKIDIRITGNADKGLAKEISGNLTKWTGIDWIVNSVQEEGEETLDQKMEREGKERITMTKSTPEMEKVLKAFPNADLKSVKDSNE